MAMADRTYDNGGLVVHEVSRLVILGFPPESFVLRLDAGFIAGFSSGPVAHYLTFSAAGTGEAMDGWNDGWMADEWDVGVKRASPWVPSRGSF